MLAVALDSEEVSESNYNVFDELRGSSESLSLLHALTLDHLGGIDKISLGVLVGILSLLRRSIFVDLAKAILSVGKSGLLRGHVSSSLHSGRSADLLLRADAARAELHGRLLTVVKRGEGERTRLALGLETDSGSRFHSLTRVGTVPVGHVFVELVLVPLSLDRSGVAIVIDGDLTNLFSALSFAFGHELLELSLHAAEFVLERGVHVALHALLVRLSDELHGSLSGLGSALLGSFNTGSWSGLNDIRGSPVLSVMLGFLLHDLVLDAELLGTGFVLSTLGVGLSIHLFLDLSVVLSHEHVLLHLGLKLIVFGVEMFLALGRELDITSGKEAKLLVGQVQVVDDLVNTIIVVVEVPVAESVGKVGFLRLNLLERLHVLLDLRRGLDLVSEAITLLLLRVGASLDHLDSLSNHLRLLVGLDLFVDEAFALAG